MQLTPVLLRMAEEGLTIDQDYAEKLNEKWKKREQELKNACGGIDIWSGHEIGKVLASEGVTVPKTPKTKRYSVDKHFLASLSSSSVYARDLLELRGMNRTREVYLEKNMLIGLHRGRVHPQYVQIARDDGGTRTGRLACKQPNFQQIPKRSRIFDASLIRHCVVPEKGSKWVKSDYRSQEIVIQVHYGLALGFGGAEEVAATLAKGEKLYHYIEKATDGRINYDQAKAVVLGRSYGMGKDKMAHDLNIGFDECGDILERFDEIVPFIAKTSGKVEKLAQRHGYLKGLMGRRRHFNTWEPKVSWADRDNFIEQFGEIQPMSKEKCAERFPNYMPIRAQVRKAYNALIQGGGATQTKKAMVDAFRAGIMPRLQVHDEINFVIEHRTQAKQIEEIMCDAIKLRLPVTVDIDVGDHWV